MSQEKRLVLFCVLVFCWILGTSYLSRKMGWDPPPRKAKPVVAAKEKADDVKSEPGQTGAEPAPKAITTAGNDKPGHADAPAKAVMKEAEKAPEEKPETKRVDPSVLVLGSTADKTPGGYRIEVRLAQKGAGVESVASSRYDGEFVFGESRKRPLEFIHSSPVSPPSLSLTLSSGDESEPLEAPADGQGEAGADEQAIAQAAKAAELALDGMLWDVVPEPGEDGKIVRSVTHLNPTTKTEIQGQAVVFRIAAKNGVIVTKTYRLFPDTDGFELEIKFESPGEARSFAYNLLGPHGIPIEGLWYTSTFRDVFFGQLTPQGEVEIKTHAAHDVASAKTNFIDNTALPLRFSGVESQYFTDLLAPDPPPTGQADRWDRRATAVAFVSTRKGDDKALLHADVAVQINSKPITVTPAEPIVHAYRIFTGPKTAVALAPFGAEKLASYRKPQYIPFAPDIARFVITPILGFTYRLTEQVARLFGGTRGNYGIAIILLTILVRALMFPLGRKQALSAQKMQALQPQVKALQEKYKDDKERLTAEQFALWKKHGVNPLTGCLPALIQLPIFVGLWQALNTSFALRHEKFLWIRDLSAPDMLFHLPFEMSLAAFPWPLYYINLGSWINVLPFLVVGLMLVQTKLFAPPPTTRDAEVQQQTMKVMMILMGIMFYKVPSGLGLYFITSSLWAIGERLLLPKISHASTAETSGEEAEKSSARSPVASGGKGGTNGDATGNGSKPAAPGWFGQFWEKVLDEARKDPTYRKVSEAREGKDRDKDRDKDRPRPKPRRR